MESAEPEVHAMDIDFEALKERDADVPELVDMHDYFSKVKPTAKMSGPAVSREKTSSGSWQRPFPARCWTGADPHPVEAVP